MERGQAHQPLGGTMPAPHNANTLLRPCGVTFHLDTLRRVGHHGDNWCHTWAADDTIIASMDDGNWLDGADRGWNNHLYRLYGGPDEFAREDLPGYPQFVFNEGGWFGYGICALDGALYSFVSKCPQNGWSGPFRGVQTAQIVRRRRHLAARGSPRPGATAGTVGSRPLRGQLRRDVLPGRVRARGARRHRLPLCLLRDRPARSRWPGR